MLCGWLDLRVLKWVQRAVDEAVGWHDLVQRNIGACWFIVLLSLSAFFLSVVKLSPNTHCSLVTLRPASKMTVVMRTLTHVLAAAATAAAGSTMMKCNQNNCYRAVDGESFYNIALHDKY